MILVNFFGGPSSGKSVASAALYVELKNNGIDTELVGEEAKSLLYKGRVHELGPDGNQLLIFSKQFARIVQLERAGTQVAISDSPLFQNIMYAPNYPYFQQLEEMAFQAEQRWESINVFINRSEFFSKHGRVQGSKEEAAVFDQSVRDLMARLEIPFAYEGMGTPRGHVHTANMVRDLVFGRML